MTEFTQYAADYLGDSAIANAFFTLMILRALFAILSTFVYDPLDDY